VAALNAVQYIKSRSLSDLLAQQMQRQDVKWVLVCLGVLVVFVVTPLLLRVFALPIGMGRSHVGRFEWFGKITSALAWLRARRPTTAK